MSSITFTEKQIRSLEENPNVKNVTCKRIEYADSFKRRFIEEYRLGFAPKDIFEAAGFDTKILGYKRIERASDRWRKEYNASLGDNTEDYVQVHERGRRRTNDVRGKLEAQELLIAELEYENRELKRQLNNLALQTGMTG